jgi:hypothetical protein
MSSGEGWRRSMDPKKSGKPLHIYKIVGDEGGDVAKD